VRVIVGDSKQAIETFMYSRNYDVIVIGYEKVCFSTVSPAVASILTILACRSASTSSC
jgi:hypothetical protein